jgi:Tfp pilus assembly protein PilN
MINLNLIPQARKNQLKNERFYSAFKEATTLLLLFAAITAIMLLLSRYYLENQLADLMQQNAANISSNEANNRRILAINSKIQTVGNIQKNFVPTRILTEKIIALIPADIACTSVNFFRQQSTIEISGNAKNREALLSFKSILEKTSWVKRVDLPMNNLINKENNTFIITLEIDPEKISI